ncbi:MAG: hypothetical protein HOQ22_11830 [Nocardioidaceae bacterium]|nr:hypothetical protein [Nocardioidaceae bacterium]NUS51713.1 hypothetical protein [Nocardioidaceae bacterium]
MVLRTALVERVVGSGESVVTVVAPPGYGKTTLLQQCAEVPGSRTVSVPCESRDDDPVELWTSVVLGLGEVTAVRLRALGILAMRGGGAEVVPSLVSVLGAVEEPVTVLLDHVESITSPECWRAIAELALRLPDGWRLVLASRTPVPIPTARLRVQGRLLELGTRDLAMTSVEVGALLALFDVRPSAETTDDLLRGTEGWPVGLYVAALALRDGAQVPDFAFTGDDRLMEDYLTAEVLDRLTPQQVRFLVRTSVLDRLSGPVCDALLGGADSARTLERLARQNLLVVPLDRSGEWYRCHHLLRDLLRAELRRDDPGQVPLLHARAARWFEANGFVELAIEHARLAGDDDRFTDLLLPHMQPVWASGRIETVRRWVEWLGTRPTSRPTYAGVAAHAALIFALLGRPAEAERWTGVAERLPAVGTLPDGSSVAATVAYLRANLCRHGPATMRRDALEALEGLGPTSPYRATMLHSEGLSHLLAGDRDTADAVFAHASDVAVAAGAAPLTAMVLAERFLVASAGDEWRTAHRMVDEAVRIVESAQLDGYWTSALVFACAARAAVHRGDMPDARTYVRRAAALRPLLTYALPVVSVQALLEIAKVYVALVDPSGARAALQQVRQILQQRPELGSLVAETTALHERMSHITASRATGVSSLTTAELRLLPLLPTHLSFPEIGAHLHVSRHTVKTQAMSVYRKLGVSSRGEAVARMTELGLGG